MAVIAPWLRGPDVLGAIEGGANAGLASRAAGDREQSEAASRQEAAQRLRLSYDQLAQTQDMEQRRIAAQQQQNQAALALRGQQAKALEDYRQAQESAAKTRIADQEHAHDAAAKILQTKQDETRLFANEIQNGADPEAAYNKHPGADPSFVHPLLAEHLKEKFAASKPVAAPKPLTDAERLRLQVDIAKHMTPPQGLDPSNQGYQDTTNRLGGISRQIDSIPSGGYLSIPAGKDAVVNAATKAAPIPKTKGELQKGKRYVTARGEATWDGEQFVQ